MTSVLRNPPVLTVRLRGRPPYGYRLITTTADEQAVRRLVPDERTAPVVLRIFTDYLGGRGLQAIAEQLTADGVPSPGHTMAWSKSAVRSILVNPRYGEFPVADGQGGPRPIVPPDEFERVRTMFAGRKARNDNGGSLQRRHLLRGMVRCARCNRLMSCTVNNAEPYYRCRYPAEYAAANKIDHPLNIYLRQKVVMGALCRWLHAACAPRRLMELDAPGVPRADRLPTIEQTALQLRGLRGCPAEQGPALQALGLRLCYSDADRTLRAKAVLEPAGLVIRGELDL